MGCSAVAFVGFFNFCFRNAGHFPGADLPVIAPFLAVLISGVVSYAQSSFRDGSLGEFSRRVFYALMAFVVIAEFRGLDRQRRLLRWLVSAFALTVFSMDSSNISTTASSRRGWADWLDPFIWRQGLRSTRFSSFGNPEFLREFLSHHHAILLTLYFPIQRGG